MIFVNVVGGGTWAECTQTSLQDLLYSWSLMSATATTAIEGNCTECDRLRGAHDDAVSLLSRVGGTQPDRFDLPVVLAAKKDLEHVAECLEKHERGRDLQRPPFL
jgi:hypothetical protein